MKTYRRTILISILIGLVGAALPAQQAGTVSGTVSDAEGAPIAGAQLFVPGTRLAVISGADGRYTMTLPAGEHQIIVHASGYQTLNEIVTPGAGESLTRDFTLAQDVLFTDEIVVVGTRRADRTVIESTVPIDVLPAQDIEQGGLTEVNQILEMLVPSFNFPRPSITDGTDHVRPATLRGLSPDQTLVLINGKRRHSTALLNVNGSIGRGSSAVDLNSIPANAIERIEVLRDGAAAQYGSDAIAGVINVVLKSGADAGFSVTAGQTGESDGAVVHLEGDWGTTFGDGGSVHVSAELRQREDTNRAGPDPRQQYFTLPDGSPDPREANFDRLNHRHGDAEVDDFGLFVNSEYPLAGGKVFYAFANYGHRNGEAGGFYRRALDNRTVRAIYPDGFLPLIESKVDDGSLALGLKGTASDWLWDVSTVWGTNAFDFFVNNSANVSLGTASPTSFDAGGTVFGQSTTNFDAFRYFKTARGPVSLAFGLEYRRENYEIQAGETASWIDGGVPVLDGPNAGARAAVGSQVFPGFRPADAIDESRDNLSFYADLETDLSDRFTLAAAARFEEYSDFGSTVSGKLAFRYEASDTVALRGAVSNGFRAPSLAQSFYSTTATVFIDGVPFEIRTFPVADAAAVALGSEPLDAEKSLNLSAGFTVSPSPNFYFTADLYQIDIDDRISLSENLTGSAVRGILESNGIFGVTGGRYFTNAIDTRTQGLDLVVRYARELSSQTRLRFTGGFNLNETEVTRVAPNPPELEGLALVRFGRTERGRIEEGQPADKISLALNVDRGPLAVLLRTIRFGEVTNRNNSDPTRDQTFSAKWITDLDVSYDLTERITLSVGGNNVFDVVPDRNIAQNSFNGIFIYNGVSPFGFNGAYYYTRLSVKVR